MRPHLQPVLFAVVSVGLLCANAPAEAASLSGTTVKSKLNRVNLTALGTADWAVWGYNNGGTSTSLVPDVRKAGGTSISNLLDLTNNSPLRGIGQFGEYGESTFRWSDGSPIPATFLAYTGIQHYSTPNTNAIEEGFSFTVPATTTPSKLTVYFTAHKGIATVTAALSDNSAAPYSATIDAAAIDNVGGIMTVDYSAASPNQTLTFTGYISSYGIDTSRYANFGLQAATLALPEPASLIAGVAGLGLIARRRRRQA